MVYSGNIIIYMSIAHILVIISALISFGGAYAYIADTIKGKTKPNRISWSMWALSPLIGTGAAIAAHADLWATSRIFLAGFLPLLVFLASFVDKKSYWQLTVFDFLCGLCSFFAIIAWILFSSTNIAILLAVLGDACASLPTLKKAWTHPHTETAITYVTSFISVVLIIPSIPSWTIENSAFQIYLLLCNSILLFTVYRKRLFN